jgi:hypothetical protein
MSKNKNNKNAIAIVVQAPLFRPPLHNNILCPRSHREREREREGQKRHVQQETRNRKRMCWDDHHHGLKINQTSCYGRLTCSLLETEQNFSSWKNSLPFGEEERKKT